MFERHGMFIDNELVASDGEVIAVVSPATWTAPSPPLGRRSTPALGRGWQWTNVAP
jgi:hypothetical protein